MDRTPFRWNPAWVLVFGLLLTAASAAGIRRAVAQRNEAAFAHAVRTTQDQIAARLTNYVNVLLAARGLVLASPELHARSFASYVGSLELDARFPGIVGVGYVDRMPAVHEPELVARRRAEGDAPEFSVWAWPRPSAGDTTATRADRFVVTYIHPVTPSNRRVLGFDMASERRRRAAMLEAAATGAPVASRKVTLAQDLSGGTDNDFVIYVPLFQEGPGAARALRGFVYGAFRTSDLLGGIFGSQPEPRVTFALYDGPPEDENLLHRGEAPGGLPQPRWRSVESLAVPGGRWTVVYRSTYGFDQQSGGPFLPVLVGLGLLASVALFAATVSQARARQVAEAAHLESERLAEELRRAVRARDDFLSIAGHELRTPLAALQLQTQALARLVERGETPKREALLERLRKNGAQVRRLEVLVDGLLDVSRITSGRLGFDLERFDLRVLVSEVVERFADQSERAGCRISVDAPAPVVGSWDRLRLDQVVTNLIGNAIKYGAGQPIEITVAAGERARLTVRDHGIGIADDARERIFGRFERAVSGRHYGGLGLGLWISREIVSGLGGRIYFETTPGGGATFVVDLPLIVEALPPDWPGTTPDQRARA